MDREQEILMSLTKEKLVEMLMGERRKGTEEMRKRIEEDREIFHLLASITSRIKEKAY